MAMDQRRPASLYLVTEEDGVTPAGLWSRKWELAVFLRGCPRQGHRVFSGPANTGARPREITGTELAKLRAHQG